MKTGQWNLILLILPLAVALPGSPQEIAVGVITQVRAEVKLYEPGARTARRADVADLLHNGSRILTGSNGEVSFLFCPESMVADAGSSTELRFSATQVQVRAGSLTNRRSVASCRLPVASVSRASAEHLGGTLLRGQNSLILLSPVGTNVMDVHVRFRWTQLDQATEYRIELTDGKGNQVWKATSTAPSLEYAGTQPLERGEVYRWRVTALQDLEVLSSASSFLRVLSEGEAARVAQLRHECAEWTQARSADPTPHLLLAFFYEELQVLDLALEEYRQAAQLAKSSEWLAGKVRALEQRLNPPI